MGGLTIRLVEGREWLEILPFDGRLGEVVGGTVFRPGDWVERPGYLSWKDAALTDPAGNTLAGPADLALVSERSRSPRPESLLLDEDLAEAVSRALAPERETTRGLGLGRRRTDEAA